MPARHSLPRSYGRNGRLHGRDALPVLIYLPEKKRMRKILNSHHALYSVIHHPDLPLSQTKLETPFQFRFRMIQADYQLIFSRLGSKRFNSPIKNLRLSVPVCYCDACSPQNPGKRRRIFHTAGSSFPVTCAVSLPELPCSSCTSVFMVPPFCCLSGIRDGYRIFPVAQPPSSR